MPAADVGIRLRQVDEQRPVCLILSDTGLANLKSLLELRKRLLHNPELPKQIAFVAVTEGQTLGDVGVLAIPLIEPLAHFPALLEATQRALHVLVRAEQIADLAVVE